MDKNIISPYIRLAIHSTIRPPFVVNTRVIYDYELIFVKDGMCKMQIEGSDYICQKNNVVFLRPGINHSFQSIEDTDFVQPHIHFDAMYNAKSKITPISYKTKEVMSAEELELIQPDIFEDIPIPYIFTPDDQIAFQTAFFNVIDLYSSKNNDIKIKAAMLNLLDIVITQFDQEKRSEEIKSSEKTSDKIVVTIKHYIDENYRNLITLDLLSDTFYINKFTLMRKFKEIYGINIIKYYNQKRLEDSKHMLKSTNVSIKNISETLHFTDLYSFSRFFKSAVGVSPNQYRKEVAVLENTDNEIP